MHLEIGDYLIRDWQREDASTLTKYADNVNIWLNLRDLFPHPYTLQDAECFLERAVSTSPNTYFALADQAGVIGSIGLGLGEDVHRFTAELGYWLAEPFWGKGIMTRAVHSLTTYAINQLGLHRIYAEPYTHNLASIRVLEKAGFKREGLLRSSAFKNGKIRDQFLYSYIAPL